MLNLKFRTIFTRIRLSIKENGVVVLGMEKVGSFGVIQLVTMVSGTVVTLRERVYL